MPIADTPRPSPPQLAWQEAELGLVFHFDLHIFDHVRYVQQQNRHMRFDPDIFAPAELDTDQWVAAARACGARFAILTASHETGFRLWQSHANPYSLKSVRWGNGQRDIVGEFVESCRRADIRPGIYLGARWNGQLGVLDFQVTERSPLSQEEYNQLIEREVEEICDRYGELFELWFDGGIRAPVDGGPDVLPIFERLQPNGLFYHSDQRRDARWGGTESGTVGYPCWATVDQKQILTKRGWGREFQELLMHGDPDAGDWCPAMADAPLRNHEWFWEEGDEEKLYSCEQLIDMYYKSVGRNATLILGATPDSRGLMPQADMALLETFGREIGRRFSDPVAETSGKGTRVELALPSPRRIDHAVIMEDIAAGERVRAYALEGSVGDGCREILCQGSCIGHKRIERFAPIEVDRVTLRTIESTDEPLIRRLAIFQPG